MSNTNTQTYERLHTHSHTVEYYLNNLVHDIEVPSNKIDIEQHDLKVTQDKIHIISKTINNLKE